MKIRLMKALVWPVATYGCESWTLRKNEETSLGAFEMKGLRRMLRVSWTAKKTNEWVFNKAGVKRKLLDTVKARKLAYCGHTIRKQGGCLEKEIMQGTMPGARRRGRPRTAWMDNIKTWTGFHTTRKLLWFRHQNADCSLRRKIYCYYYNCHLPVLLYCHYYNFRHTLVPCTQVNLAKKH